MNKRLKLELVEIGGIRAMLEALRLPYGKEPRSTFTNSFNIQEFEQYIRIDQKIIHNIDRKDISLIKTLTKRGDEHAKVTRGLIYYVKITATRWFLTEMVTYTVGTIPLGGTSTMHIDCKGMSGEELMEFKDDMPQGNLETRVIGFSIQTLHRIYRQRKDHRLDVWKDFCRWVETLPLIDLVLN